MLSAASAPARNGIASRDAVMRPGRQLLSQQSSNPATNPWQLGRVCEPARSGDSTSAACAAWCKPTDGERSPHCKFCKCAACSACGGDLDHWLGARVGRPHVPPEAIVLISACLFEYARPSWHAVHANQRRYAATRAHRFLHVNETTLSLCFAHFRTSQALAARLGFDRPPDWVGFDPMYARFFVLLAWHDGFFAEVQAEWAFWSDCDTIFLSPSMGLELFVDPQPDVTIAGDRLVRKDLVVARPTLSVNTGHVFFRRSDWVRGFALQALEMRTLSWRDPPAWQAITAGWMNHTGRAWMHDQSLIEALLGGAQPSEPWRWAAHAVQATGTFENETDSAAARHRLPASIRKRVQILPWFTINSGGAHLLPEHHLSFHATGGCGGHVATKVEAKRRLLLAALSPGNHTNPCDPCDCHPVRAPPHCCRGSACLTNSVCGGRVVRGAT